MKSRRNVRRNRKSRKNKRGGGIFGEKTESDVRTNCRNYEASFGRNIGICDEPGVAARLNRPGRLRSLFGATTGTQVGTSAVGEMFKSNN
jgi:hypothetical protein